MLRHFKVIWYHDERFVRRASEICFSFSKKQTYKQTQQAKEKSLKWYHGNCFFAGWEILKMREICDRARQKY